MHRVTVRLTEKQRGIYFDLGGTIWLRRILDEATHPELKAAAKLMLAKSEKTNKGTK